MVILLKLIKINENFLNYKKINCKYYLIKIGKNYYIKDKNTRNLMKVKHKTMNKILFENPECELGELRILKKKMIILMITKNVLKKIV